MKKQFISLLLLAGITLAASACATKKTAAPPPSIPPTSALQQGSPCTGPVCASLVVTQSGHPGKMNLSAQGIRSAAPFALPAEQTGNGRFVIDTGVPSPNGVWAAYTTIGKESGGPVLLQNLQTGAWTDLIQAVNAQLPAGQSPFREDDLWDVIGWFPDSTQLMIGPLDRSQVVIVNPTTFANRQVVFAGGGRGGRLFVNLAPDGKWFLFVGEDAAGNQVLNAMDLASGQVTELLKQPYDQGVLYNPRSSPDQKNVAYLVQKGQPDAGLAYSINLLSTNTGQSSTLVEGNLGMTIPAWSLDSRTIAFTRNRAEQANGVVQGATPQAEVSEVWTVSIADGKQSQVSFMGSQARNPVWASDGKTLAFVSGDGQVDLVDITQPGKVWQVAGPSADPQLTSFFFLP